MSSDYSRRLRFFIIVFLICTSSLGMVLCGSVRFLFYDSNDEMMNNSFWSAFTMVSIFIFMLTIFVLFPFEILYFERKERIIKGNKLGKLTFSDLFGLPFGVTNPDAEIPSFIKYLVLVPLFLLIGIFFIFLLGISIAYVAKLFHG